MCIRDSCICMWRSKFRWRTRLGTVSYTHLDVYKRQGDIGAAVGFKDIKTGDTLSDEKNPIVLESMIFPDPVIGIAVEPKTKADQDKLGNALSKLAEEDPTFQVKTDEASGQTIISGMGELHLDIIVDRLRREFKVEVNQGQPQVEYKDCLLYTSRCV